MAEKEIKRMNFFDGQFLKEGEFIDEQYYHLHMRRRMNYILFENAGVINVNSDDLKFINIDNSNKTFRVKAGMAISRNDNDMEAKEIILRQDSPTLNLNDEGITSGQTAYVTIHYEEELANDPPSEGDIDKETRVKEKAVVEVHSSKPTGPAPNGEEYIYLGALNYDNMTNPDYNNRNEAKIRASLVGAAALPAPTIMGISEHSGVPGDVVTATITGTNLTGANAVAFSGSGVTATIQPGGTATALSVSITIDAAASSGPRTFTVTTPGGTADSAGVVGAEFEVETPPQPVVVSSFSPGNVVPGQSNFQIRGSNIRDPNLSTGASAAGTTVRFADSTDETTVLAETTTVVVMNDLADETQRIRVTIPDASAFGSPSSGTTLTVKVQVSFGGSVGTSANTLDIIFP